MKKLLLIILLIVGCDNSTEPEGCISLPSSYPLIHNQVSIYENRLYNNANNYLIDIPDSTYYDTLVIKETQEDYYIRYWGDVFLTEDGGKTYIKDTTLVKNENGRHLIIGDIDDGNIDLREKPYIFADFNDTIIVDESVLLYMWERRIESEVEFESKCYQSYKFTLFLNNTTTEQNATFDFTQLGFHQSSEITDYNDNTLTNKYLRRKLISISN